MAYEVRTQIYEGPFDVLLRLINEQRVELYDVRLSDIVDAFLAEIAGLERIDLEGATEFLLIAAILVELKSRRLLPELESAVREEDLALLEERDYLLSRLVECTTFSAAGRRLFELESQASRSYPRMTGPDERFAGLAPDLLAGVNPDDLRQAAARALAERPRPRVEIEHVLVDEVTVAEVVQSLQHVLVRSGTVTFRELTIGTRSRNEVVVHFLGILELYKQGLVELDQVVTFGDIVVTWVGGTPDDDDAAGAGRDLVSTGWLTGTLAEMDYRG